MIDIQSSRFPFLILTTLSYCVARTNYWYSSAKGMPHDLIRCFKSPTTTGRRVVDVEWLLLSINDQESASQILCTYSQSLETGSADGKTAAIIWVCSSNHCLAEDIGCSSHGWSIKNIVSFPSSKASYGRVSTVCIIDAPSSTQLMYGLPDPLQCGSL